MSNKTLLLAALLALPILADARTRRDPSQVREFRAEKPCPSTGLYRGRCFGYEVDHRTPLCAGGEDRPENMQWLSKDDHKKKTKKDVRHCAALRKGRY